ncbi:hypothetical protein [Mycoplasma sp. Ms02]|uniref:hypothetical protein n=1 Tax=Mycoplasma sp. Ms02 TaxID=353851 RepID=UPI001C8AF552|nr:hypothetical protein [Mycoplasma sp. Ms02]QZE12665.1 hypothetical protein K4L35_01620 [Mycoplasma sp. Ms02]
MMRIIQFGIEQNGYTIDDWLNNFEEKVDEYYPIFQKELKKEINLINKKQKKSSENRKKYFETHRFVRSGYENYAINVSNENDENNSKQYGMEIQRLKNLIEKHQATRRILNEEIIVNAELVNSLSISILAVSVTNLLCAGLGFFVPGLSLASIPISVTTYVLSEKRTEAENHLENLKTLDSAFNSLFIGETPLKAFERMWNNITSPMSWGVAAAQTAMTIDAIKKDGIVKQFKPTWPKASEKFSLALNKISFFLGASDTFFSYMHLRDSNANLSKVYKFSENLLQCIDSLTKELEQKKDDSISWVVIHETRQTGFYWDGGKGGKNLIFRNMNENKNYSLEELLSKSDEELYTKGLRKVFNSKLNEWYIRTIRNKTKKDNLG